MRVIQSSIGILPHKNIKISGEGDGYFEKKSRLVYFLPYWLSNP
jgi:hypothetical protein